MHNREYNEYLQSPEWKEKRRLKAEEQNYTCEICHKIVRKGFHVHHKTYSRFMNESLSDLMFLCEDCHMKLHKKREEQAKKKHCKKKKSTVSCYTCKYSQVMKYKGIKTGRNVLYCNKQLKECDSVCDSYYRGDYKKPFIKHKKKKNKCVRKNIKTT